MAKYESKQGFFGEIGLSTERKNQNNFGPSLTKIFQADIMHPTRKRNRKN